VLDGVLDSSWLRPSVAAHVSPRNESSAATSAHCTNLLLGSFPVGLLGVLCSCLLTSSAVGFLTVAFAER